MRKSRVHFATALYNKGGALSTLLRVYDNMTTLRKFAVILTVLIIGSVGFTGGAIATADQDADQTNVQVADQDASISQGQSSTTFNAALWNGDDQTATTEQSQNAEINQDVDQDMTAINFNQISF